MQGKHHLLIGWLAAQHYVQPATALLDAAPDCGHDRAGLHSLDQIAQPRDILFAEVEELQSHAMLPAAGPFLRADDTDHACPELERFVKRAETELESAPLADYADVIGLQEDPALADVQHIVFNGEALGGERDQHRQADAGRPLCLNSG
jgi:hypothetical protein